MPDPKAHSQLHKAYEARKDNPVTARIIILDLPYASEFKAICNLLHF